MTKHSLTVGSLIAAPIVLIASMFLGADDIPMPGRLELSIPLKTGNLGIDEVLSAKRSRLELTKFRDLKPLEKIRDYGIGSMEDYVPWFSLEPAKNQWNWALTDHDLTGVQAARMDYTIYPFFQFVPDWVVGEPDFQGFECLEHQRKSTFPSIFAPSTYEYFERFYRQLSEHLESKVSQVYVAVPADFGEVAYPQGAASNVWSYHHMHEGWWINDRFARADFQGYLQKRYGTIDALNTRWKTHYKSFSAVEYPTFQGSHPNPHANPTAWLDFMDWYRSALTAATVKFVQIAKRYFPDKPVEIKIGHPDEKPIYGTDVAGLFRAARDYGFAVRSTAAVIPPDVYNSMGVTKHDINFFLGIRQATAAHFYGVRFVTEEFGEIPKQMSLERIFTDASNGVAEVYLGPQTFMNALEYYKLYGQYMHGDQAQTRVALYYPSTDHLLGDPERQLPPGVFEAANSLRDRMVFDVVDDAEIADGILSRYVFLFVSDQAAMPAATLSQLGEWVRAGGVLAHPFGDWSPPVIRDGKGTANTPFGALGDHAVFAGYDIHVRRVGRGALVSADKPDDYYDIVVELVYRGSTLLPGLVTEPLYDDQADQVYVTPFRDRLLLFNAATSTRSLHLTLDPRHFPKLTAPRSLEIELPERSLREISIQETTSTLRKATDDGVSSFRSKGTAEKTEDKIRARLGRKMQEFQERMEDYVSKGGDVLSRVILPRRYTHHPETARRTPIRQFSMNPTILCEAQEM